MRNIKWLAAAGLLVSATGCGETNGYPQSSYGSYPSNGYYSQPTYYQRPASYEQPAYYQQAQPRYAPASNSRSWWGRRDDDGDGIPNR